MENWQQRVIEERDQLNDKITRLFNFLSKDLCRPYSEDHRMLSNQLSVMFDYLSILNERIEKFENKKPRAPSTTADKLRELSKQSEAMADILSSDEKIPLAEITNTNDVSKQATELSYHITKFIERNK